MRNDDIKHIESVLDYGFKNSDLLQQAFVRRSYSEENGGENNEVLEFIGDKVLDLVVIKVMMENFSKITNGDYSEVHLKNPSFFKTQYDEGKFTDIKKQLVEKKTLAYLMTKLGFNKYLIMGKGDIKENIQNQDSVKEDLFEAILGAVAVDCDYDIDTLEHVTRNMIDFEEFFGISESNGQSFSKNLAEYLKEYGYNNSEKEYIKFDDGWGCNLTIDCSERIFKGFGETKEKACNKAAMNALAFIENDYNYLEEMRNEINDFDENNSINKLQELYQKKYIEQPMYKFKQNTDDNGNPIWKSICSVGNYRMSWKGISTNKKDAKKYSAYSMLEYIYNDEVCDE